MSIQRMRQRFAVQLRIVLWALTIAFIIGLPLVFVPGRFFAGEEGARGAASGGQAAVARVNGKPVTRSEVERIFERSANQILHYYSTAGQAFGLEMLWRMRLDAMEQAVENEILIQQAEKLGVLISKGDVKQRAQDLVEQEMAQLKSQTEGADLERFLAWVVATEERTDEPPERVSEKNYRKWRLSQYTDPSFGLRGDMVIERLRQSVVGQVSVTEQDLRQSYDVARVRRIVVSLKPYGEPERTEEEARERAEALLARAKAGGDFGEIARTESDAPGAEQTGGLLERVRRGRMPAQWDEVVFALQPDQISDVIEVTQGFEIVNMEKLEQELPDDFQENKERLLNGFAEQRRTQAWQAYVSELADKSEIEVVDKEMLAYQAVREDEQEEALALLEEAVPQAREAGGLAAAAVFFELATLKASRNDWEAAAEYYGQSGDTLSWSRRRGERIPGGRAQTLLGMARAYEGLNDTEEAVIWYTAASDSTEIPSIHAQVRSALERIGREDLAEKEKEWMDRYEQRQRERQEAIAAQQKALEEQRAGPARSSPPPAPPREAEPGQ